MGYMAQALYFACETHIPFCSRSCHFLRSQVGPFSERKDTHSKCEWRTRSRFSERRDVACYVSTVNFSPPLRDWKKKKRPFPATITLFTSRLQFNKELPSCFYIARCNDLQVPPGALKTTGS